MKNTVVLSIAMIVSSIILFAGLFYAGNKLSKGLSITLDHDIPKRIALDSSSVKIPQRIVVDSAGFNIPEKIIVDSSDMNIPNRIALDSSDMGTLDVNVNFPTTRNGDIPVYLDGTLGIKGSRSSKEKRFLPEDFVIEIKESTGF